MPHKDSRNTGNRMFLSLRTKFMLGLTLLALLLILVLSFISSITYRSELEGQYAETAYLVARTVAETIDGDRIGYYLETLTEDDYYKEEYDFMYKVMQNEKIKYVYVVVPEEDGGRYVWNVVAEGEEVTELNKLGAFEEYWNEAEFIMKDTYNTGTTTNNAYITNSAQYGYIASVYAPVYASDGSITAVVGVDIDMIDIEADLRDYIILIVACIIITVFVFITVYTVFITKTLINPIKRLTDCTSSFTEGGELRKIDFKVNTNDELGRLGKAFSQMAADIERYSINLANTAAERERIKTELAVCENIQVSQLPDKFNMSAGMHIGSSITSRDEIDICADMKPAHEVGGDFYDYFMIDSHRFGIVIADIAGKGVSAVTMMIITKTLIKYHLQTGETPERVMEAVNAQLCENNDSALFVTAFVGVLDVDDGKFTYVNAGHMPPLLMRNQGEFEFVKSKSGFVMAEIPNVRFRQVEISLRQGDIIYLYTSGLPEVKSPDGKIFGRERLVDVLNRSRKSMANVHDTVNVVNTSLNDFSGGEPQINDITQLVLEYRKGSREFREITVKAVFASVDKVSSFISAHLDENDISTAFQMRFAVAVEDIFAGVIGVINNTDEITVRCTIITDTSHASPKTGKDPFVTIEYSWEGEENNPLENTNPGVLNLNAVGKYADNIDYFYVNGHNTLTFTKKL